MDQMKAKQRMLSVWFSTELKVGERANSISEAPRCSGVVLSSTSGGSWSGSSATLEAWDTALLHLEPTMLPEALRLLRLLELRDP